MSINSFLNQTISLKIIIVVSGFWLIVAAFALYYFFGGIKEGFQAGLVGLGLVPAPILAANPPNPPNPPKSEFNIAGLIDKFSIKFVD